MKAPLKRGLTTAEVAERLAVPTRPSQDATIDSARLELVADLIRGSGGAQFQRSQWGDPLFWNVEASDEDRSQYFAVGNAINFRFWDLSDGEVLPSTGVIGGSKFRGAMYMWRCLRQALEEDRFPVLDAEALASLSADDLDDLFTDDQGARPLDPGKDDRLENLRDLGARLNQDWGGSFYELVKASGGSIVEFARLSGIFRAFDDPLHKLTMVNAILHSGSGVYTFDDDVLPGIDYQILKQLLRQGVVRPSEQLGQKLRTSSLLDPIASYELRRQALAAMVRLSELTGLGGEVLDNYYWLNRSVCSDPLPMCVDPDLAERCPFLGSCSRFVEIGRPLELTRYY